MNLPSRHTVEAATYGQPPQVKAAAAVQAMQQLLDAARVAGPDGVQSGQIYHNAYQLRAYVGDGLGHSYMPQIDGIWTAITHALGTEHYWGTPGTPVGHTRFPTGYEPQIPASVSREHLFTAIGEDGQPYTFGVL